MTAAQFTGKVHCVYKVADCISASLSRRGGKLKLAVKTKNFQHLEAFCREQQAALPPSTNQKPMHNYHTKLQTLIDLLSLILKKHNFRIHEIKRGRCAEIQKARN